MKYVAAADDTVVGNTCLTEQNLISSGHLMQFHPEPTPTKYTLTMNIEK